jgi:hypothetical protein
MTEPKRISDMLIPDEEKNKKTIERKYEMPRYKVTLWAKAEAVVEALDESEAIGIVSEVYHDTKDFEHDFEKIDIEEIKEPVTIDEDFWLIEGESND